MNWLQRLMYGRYGVDQFSLFLIAVYLVLYLVGSLLRLGLLSWLALLVAAYALFRLFSGIFPGAGQKMPNLWSWPGLPSAGSGCAGPFTGTKTTAISSAPTAASS